VPSQDPIPPEAARTPNQAPSQDRIPPEAARTPNQAPSQDRIPPKRHPIPIPTLTVRVLQLRWNDMKPRFDVALAR
jgi:hypothetical protein